MKNRSRLNVIILGLALVVLLVLVGYFFCFQNVVAPPVVKPATATVARTAAKPTLPQTLAAAKPEIQFEQVTAVKHLDNAPVAQPVMAPVVARAAQPESSASAVDPPVPAAPVVPATAEDIKVVTNNLRQLASAAQQYMLDKGTTHAAYNDLVGLGVDDYIRSITPVVGEVYTNIEFEIQQSQVELVLPDGTSVIYDM